MKTENILNLASALSRGAISPRGNLTSGRNNLQRPEGKRGSREDRGKPARGCGFLKPDPTRIGQGNWLYESEVL